MAALAIVLIGQFGRAGVDKLLALHHGPEMVAHWAQLQSIVELVSGIALVGLGQGLTVLVAQAGDSLVQRQLLRDALWGGFLLAVVATGITLALPGGVIARLLPGDEALHLLPAATAVGSLAVGAGMLAAFWQGRQQPPRILLLTLAGNLPLLAAAWLLADATPAPTLLGVQAVVYLLFLVPVFLVAGGATGPGWSSMRRRLWRYLPVGLAIGVLSPGSVLLVRSVVSDSLSWTDVGLLQAVWRYSEWVTVSVAGLLALVFLPRLSAAAGGPGFVRELRRCFLWLLLPASFSLALLFALQKTGLALLYDERFVVPRTVVGLVMLGDVLRMGAWVFLYGLFATGRTRWITAGEFLSLPLYALMITAFAKDISLERAAGLYTLTYAVYAAFNAYALVRGRVGRAPAVSV